MPKGIRIAIVDDELLFRSGLISLLERFGIAVVGVAPNGEELMPILLETKPHVVLLDLEMPKVNGSRTLNNIRRDLPAQSVIIISKYHDEELIKDLFNRGANAFISKISNDIHVMIEAIKRVNSHGIYKDNIPDLIKSPARKDGHYFKLILSKREIEVLHLLYQSYSYKEIGERLFISTNTVENHAKSIFKKMQVKNREELSILAFNLGLNFLGGH